MKRAIVPAMEFLYGVMQSSTTNYFTVNDDLHNYMGRICIKGVDIVDSLNLI